MKPKLIFVRSTLLSVSLAASLQAQVPLFLNYQGKLIIDNKPITDEVDVTFTIFDDSLGGIRLWSELQKVKPANGLFNVLLGSGTSLSSTALENAFTGMGKRFLALKVGNQELKPRARIASVAYAIKAESANSLDAPDGGPTDAVFVDVGSTTNPHKLLHVRNGDINIDDSSAFRQKRRWVIGGDPTLLSIGDATSTDGRDIRFDPGFPGAMIIKNGTGNVGIGTTNPTANLHVAGTLMRLGNASGGQLRFHNGTSDVGVLEVAPDGNRMDFYAGGASANNLKLSIESGGNVGIGTTNPKAKLDVFGSIAFSSNSSIYRDGALNAIVFNTPGVSGNPKMVIRDNGNVGIGTTTPSTALEVGGCVIAQNVSCSSSRRWKTNIQPLEGALEKVQQLRGVSYVWKEDSKQNIGLIAEEVAEVIPEVVSFEENGKDARAVDYSRLVAVLIEAMKEQQKTIAELQSRMKSLEKRKR